jgi:hypothetical protein
MEVTLGRKLTKNECVHHVDGDKLNNDPGNLVVLSRSEHQRLHQTGAKPKRWTAEEKARGRALLQAGMTIQDIASVLLRGYSTTSRYCARWAKELLLATRPVASPEIA